MSKDINIGIDMERIADKERKKTKEYERWQYTYSDRI